MEKVILLDIAEETARKYGIFPNDFARKMTRRIQRKFAVKLDINLVQETIQHYTEVYLFGKSVFKEYLKPKAPTDQFAQLADVDFKSFIGRIKDQFATDETEILERICGWVIYFEYLR